MKIGKLKYNLFGQVFHQAMLNTLIKFTIITKLTQPIIALQLYSFVRTSPQHSNTSPHSLLEQMDEGKK